MDRAERNGFAVAIVGHVLLFGALSLGLLTARIPKPPIADAMDVTITDKVGLTSAAPKVVTEAPAPSEAPDQGAPEESAPPPPAPEPAPAPPEPAPPKPKPAPPKPEKPHPKPVAKPAPEKPEPKPRPEPKKPEPKPKPKPAPEKPDKPEKPTPEKAAPQKSKPDKTKADKAKSDKAKSDKAKSDKTKPDTSATDDSAPGAKGKPTPAKRHGGLPSDLLSDLPGDAPGKGKAEKARGSRIGKDFLKGLSADKSAGKSTAPRAAAVSALALNGIGALIKQQVRPNYNPPSGGTDSASIVTTLNITMARDGSVSAVEVVGHRGVNDSNGGYVKQADDAAIRAVRRSSPLKLPPDLYDGGWENITLNFSPAQMQ